jgi:hypothetical protein
MQSLNDEPGRLNLACCGGNAMIDAVRRAAAITLLRRIAGWGAVATSTLLSCFWSFWGIIENFHEGWWSVSLRQNLSMLLMYLLPMLAIMGVALAATRWPRIGGCLHIGAGVFAWWFFSGGAAHHLIAFPLAILGVCYWIGRPEPRKWAYALIATLPLIVLVACGIEPAVRTMRRFDDGNLGIRAVQGNGLELIWAPAGPGWPKDGVTWTEAKRRCRYLTADGLRLADTPQDVWRLPTAEETVRSLCRYGRHAGGEWHASEEKARYAVIPDKESPLWDSRSQVIYWWTSTEVGTDRALMVSYNGYVKPLPKSFAPGYLGFRAVKEPVRAP